MKNARTQNLRAIKIWIGALCFIICLIVFVGGITRLTQSGLSMVNWEPIKGVMPPLNATEWQAEFSKYQAYPEFQKLNRHMTLDEFKGIFFWEYLHRILARSLSLIFFFPWLYFFIKKRIDGKLSLKLWGGFLLGGLQGLLGWYMVKSGLVERPSVSHFRLAAHLSLALFTLCYFLWILFSLNINRDINRVQEVISKKQKYLVYLFFSLLSLQIVYGALVAGLDAGLYFNTFPKMGEQWFPSENLNMAPYYLNFIQSPIGNQWVHRYLGKILFILSIALLFIFRKRPQSLSRSTQIIFAITVWQFLLGVATLLHAAPLYLASLHQISAVVLLSFSLYLVFQIRSRSTNLQSQ